MGSSDKFVQAYHFLLDKETLNQPFALDEICEAIGWKPKTVRTYLSKKWEKLITREGELYFVTGISTYELDQFVRLMSQKQSLSEDPLRPILDIEVERLVTKAREAAINAVDSYNRYSTVFKTECYIVMMVIAWRCLFHAIFEEEDTDYFYKNSDGTPRMIDGEESAWDVSQCMHEYFGASTNPIRKNLDFIVGLRNKIEHRFVPAIDHHVGGECQALLLNFDELLATRFGEYYALRETLTMPLQTSNIRSGAQLEAIKKFQGKQYDDLKDYIEDFRTGLSEVIANDMRYSFQLYLIPKTANRESSGSPYEFIKYDPDNPDMVDLERRVVMIKERQVPVANAGTFKPSQVAKIVSQKIGQPFTIHHHTNAWRMYNVRQSGETPEGCNIKYCQFDQLHRDYIYTQDWIDFLVGKLSSLAEYQRLLAFKAQ